MIISITDAAVTHIKSMLAKQPGSVGFRLSIKKTGCSGYAYLPTIITEIKADDLPLVFQKELPVFIDPTCVEFVKGTVIDYVAEQTEGLKQKRLVFINPNEKNRCGCGESFQV